MGSFTTDQNRDSCIVKTGALLLVCLCVANCPTPNHFTMESPPSTIHQVSEHASEYAYGMSTTAMIETLNGGLIPSFTDSTLPDFNATSGRRFFDGCNLFVLEVRNRTDSQVVNRSLIICDMQGQILLQKPLGTGFSLPEFSAEFVGPRVILIGSGSEEGLDGSSGDAVLLNLSDSSATRLGFSGHHEYEYNHRTDTVFTFESYLATANGSIYVYDMIREFNLTGYCVWSFDTQTLVPPGRWHPRDMFDTTWPFYDVTHSNTIFFDNIEDIIYYNSRNLSTFYKINHTDSKVIWGLGEYGNFALFNRWGDERDTLFYHAHSVERVDDNTFIIFDNGPFNQTDPANERSRLVEITVNETAMTAYESWSWTAPHEYYSVIWGDADRLPNGNRLGVFGTPNHPDCDIGARIVEVNPAGDIVWELNFPHSEDFTYGVYRAERFRYSPTVSTASETIRAVTHENVSVTWDIWYNFRPKHTVTGTYALYLNGTLVENGTCAYDRFWRAKRLVSVLGQLETGNYNVTLEVSDEDGHTAASSVTVSVSDFYIDREGPLSFEIGQEKHRIVWSGETSGPLDCNITIDAALHDSLVWTGSNISVGLLTLGVGNHSVCLRLFNGTNLVYEDSMMVAVYPSEEPVFLSVPPLAPFRWNASTVVSWTFTDKSPATWHLYINSSAEECGTWNCTTYTLNWKVPTEGLYNLTLDVFDSAGHVARCSSWLVMLPPSPPIFTSTPGNCTVTWGAKGVTFTWEVHGGSSWGVWRNGTVILEDELHGNLISVAVADWRTYGWRPGLYNLTLLVFDSNSSARSTVWIGVTVDLGDPYADSHVKAESLWVSFPENALGPPDGQSARIFVDYGNGYLTLDMGASEEIVDGQGNDLNVIAGGGTYAVLASSSLSELFVPLGAGSGSQSFDLVAAGIEMARYVRIEYVSGEFVMLDAIVALNFNRPVRDTESPQVYGPEDFWIWANQTYATLMWNASDATPWSYSILINGSHADSGNWNGSGIVFVFMPQGLGTWSVTLLLTDAFDNCAQDTVFVQVRARTTTTTPTVDVYVFIAVSACVLGVCVALVYIAAQYHRRIG